MDKYGIYTDGITTFTIEPFSTCYTDISIPERYAMDLVSVTYFTKICGENHYCYRIRCERKDNYSKCDIECDNNSFVESPLIADYFASLDTTSAEQIKDFHNFNIKLIERMFDLFRDGIMPSTKSADSSRTPHDKP